MSTSLREGNLSTALRGRETTFRNKHHSFYEVTALVISHNTDILALTETWLGTCADPKVLSDLIPPGCNILQVA